MENETPSLKCIYKLNFPPLLTHTHTKPPTSYHVFASKTTKFSNLKV